MTSPRKFLVIRSRSIKTVRGKKVYYQHCLSLPDEIVKHIPEGTKFTPELTEEGILLRITSGEDPPMNLPSWAKK